jgi:hypothetical protein
MTQFLAVIKILWELYGIIRKFLKEQDAVKKEQWFQKSSEVFVQVKAANTPELKKDAIKKLSSLWRDL